VLYVAHFASWMLPSIIVASRRTFSGQPGAISAIVSLILLPTYHIIVITRDERKQHIVKFLIIKISFQNSWNRQPSDSISRCQFENKQTLVGTRYLLSLNLLFIRDGELT